MIKPILIPIPALAVLTACTSLSTAPTTAMPSDTSNMIQGLVYYLPTGRIHIVGAPAEDSTKGKELSATAAAAASDKDNSPFKITITADITADVCGGYFVKRDSNYIYDDTIDIKIDGATGLLSSGKATSKDETAEIISDLAKTGTYLMKMAPPTPAPPDLKSFDIVFYPECAKVPAGGMSFCDARDKLSKCGFDLKSAHLTPARNLPADSKMPCASANPGPKFHNGLAFRLPALCAVSISTNVGASITVTTSKTVLLPDTSHTYYLDYSRMPFVAKKTSFGFTNGMLTEYSQDIPSPIAGFLGIPKAIIQAIIPLPTGSSAPTVSSTGASTSSSPN